MGPEGLRVEVGNQALSLLVVYTVDGVVGVAAAGPFAAGAIGVLVDCVVRAVGELLVVRSHCFTRYSISSHKVEVAKT